MNAMPPWYEQFAAALSAVGILTNGVEHKAGWSRTTVHVGENSFWITVLSDHWYLGTWGGLIYRLTKSQQAVKLCIDWFSRPNRTYSDFDEGLKADFELIEISEQEFDRIAAASK